ncbi:hypothetical protein [Methylotenera sp.]|uniref:hypothetical protein n=1 Tax=Methylotenera sp. TaxID=2051956 RepID=UPI00272581B0|nr:hypothetical protein [Methylotenera sp.]MDO9204118.1 hypothetical protein [Methylotenera sp.]MDP2071720.1 hypothetical protein [Methylotenera sp.]MDP3006073.1 hypothetical protein [Methylotenera sp.]
MARFIAISDSFLITLPHEEATTGHTYIDKEKILSVKTSGASSDGKIIIIQMQHGEIFRFFYDETHPDWILLFSWLNE